MKYITIADLSQTIRRNLWKIPHDIDAVIGVPRSGMIAASLISSYLNVPLIDIDSYITGRRPSGGSRLRYFEESHKSTGKILVVDDTVWQGFAMQKVRDRLKNFKGDYIYTCVYLEGKGEKSVDIWLEDLRPFTENFTQIVLYEWNILQHHAKFMSHCLYDIDGVMCVEPPDERDEEKYLEYIRNAKPLFIPRTPIGGIITYRLKKNREITERWLKEQGVQCRNIYMFPAHTWQERKDTGVSSATFKGRFYKERDEFKLFVESDAMIAIRIAAIANKPVFCVETNEIYQ